MELPRIVHDEFLHKVEEPQAQHIVETLQAAALVSNPLAKDVKRVLLVPTATHDNESTPLLSKQVLPSPASPSSVIVELSAVDAILDKEAKVAAESDSKMTTWEIVADECKRVLNLSIPMILVGALEIFPEMILSMMVGHTNVDQSTQILAAFNQCALMMIIIVAVPLDGLASAIDTLCSQAFGGKRMVELWLFCQGGLLLYLAFMPVMMGLLSLATPILIALGQDPSIAAIAGKLLLVDSLTIPPCIVFYVMKSALQAQNIAFPFVLSSVIGWSLSASTAYFLAFHTSMGYMGVIVATPMCWTIKCLVLMPVVLRNWLFIKSWPGWKFKEAWRIVPKIWKLAGSSLLMVLFQVLTFPTIALLAGLLPDPATVITANGIFAYVLSLSNIPLLGVCVSGAIRVGNALGAGQARRAQLIGHITLATSTTIAVVATFVVASVATSYASSFTPDPQAIQAASDLTQDLLPMITLMGVTASLQAIFRACGKQKLCAQFNFACLLVLGVPLGLLFAFHFNGGVVGLWSGNLIGLVVFAVVGGVWLARMDWEQMAREAKHNTQIHVQVQDEKASRKADAY